MIRARLEPDPRTKLKQLGLYVEAHKSKSREELINIAINWVDKNINERIVALLTFRKILENTPKNLQKRALTNHEMQKLYHLIKDDAEFPIIVYPDQFTVEEITHEKNHEDSNYKKTITINIEENDAVLRAEAALLIVDFGQETKKYDELKHKLVSAITAILGNMLGEPNNLFVKEVKENSDWGKPSSCFIRFVEALYFIDEEAARPFMSHFNVQETDFSHERRKRKVN